MQFCEGMVEGKFMRIKRRKTTRRGGGLDPLPLVYRPSQAALFSPQAYVI